MASVRVGAATGQAAFPAWLMTQANTNATPVMPASDSDQTAS
jgi:hypothetical protein